MSKRTRTNVISILLMTALAGCDLLSTAGDEASQEAFERRELPRQLSTGERHLADATGAFGFDLMNRLVGRQPDKNHFVSPLSILMAFGMTMNGAEGQTYPQLQEAFGLDGMSRNNINQSARKLFELLTGFDEQVRFDLANSI